MQFYTNLVWLFMKCFREVQIHLIIFIFFSKPYLIYKGEKKVKEINHAKN